jgi:ubiquinone/menaquinone biosynthesis C-methylase UbiE
MVGRSQFVAASILFSLAGFAWSNGVAFGADEDPNIPPALKGYKGREIAVTMHYSGATWLTRESREREEECSTLLKALNVQPGMTVCDLGCGNGFYTLELAKMVGEKGVVYGVDIQQEMLHLLDERAKGMGITNVKPVHGGLTDPKLPAASQDLILLVDVYHEFSHPEHMLQAMRKALKPNGRIALVEFRLEDPKVPIKLLHKMSKKQILKEYVPNGFKLVEQFDKLPWQHVMFFQVDPDWKRGEPDRPKTDSDDFESEGKTDADRGN